MTPPSPGLAEDDVLALTDLGRAELNKADTSLTVPALKVLVLVDGRSSVSQLAAGMPVLPPSEVRANLAGLLSAGLVRSTKQEGAALGAIDPGDFFKTIGRPLKLPEVTDPSAREAIAGLSTLKDNGYFVRIARRAAARPPRAEGVPRTALVVDDDPDVGALLDRILRLEAFEVIVAANKAQVLDALRRPSVPDLALLDVQLPDVDGFHILSRMRQHPNLKFVPTVMLTASATRADVLKGLHFGADAYVTKPFNYEVLMKAVHTVLGTGAPGASAESPSGGTG